MWAANWDFLPIHICMVTFSLRAFICNILWIITVLLEKRPNYELQIFIVKAVFFPVVIYECESWTIKKAKRWRIDAFKLVLEKILVGPLHSKIKLVHPKGDQSWIFNIHQYGNSYSSKFINMERLMLKLKLKYFGHLMQRADLLEKKPWCWERVEGMRQRRWQRMRWLDGISDSMSLSLSKLWEMGEEQGSLVCCSPWGCKELDTA